jgi:pyrimidine-specific ribonucleoside hydrolase
MNYEVLFDMETSDPDDVATLCFLCYHPEINLGAVTVTPGTLDQVGLVKGFLRRCHKDIPVGSRKPDHPKDCVSGFFRKHYKVEPAKPDGLGHDIISSFFKAGEGRILLTGAPLGNPREALEKHDDFEIARWVGQGGFAGDSVVPEEFRLDKFRGLETCPTFNFNGDRKGATLMLESPCVRSRQLVSKNVCHGMAYDINMHEQVSKPAFCVPAFCVFQELMEDYLSNHPQGKLFHDPLAAATIVRPDICAYEGVEVYYEGGKWGSRKKEGSNTRISVNADRQKFIEVLKQVKFNGFPASKGLAGKAVDHP